MRLYQRTYLVLFAALNIAKSAFQKNIFRLILTIFDYLKPQSKNNTQHDEVEPHLKKIPHRNGIWGLEANSM